jgi:hypothetical protein
MCEPIAGTRSLASRLSCTVRARDAPHNNQTKEQAMKVFGSVSILAMTLLASPLCAQTQAPTPPPAQTAPSASAQPQWYSHQADEMRASKLIGASVRNDANESIGSINELILGKDGRLAAVVVGVGGFLGIGEREVALDFKSLKFERDTSATARADSVVVRVNATRDALKAAPAWTWDERSSTGSPPATPPANRPAPGGTTTK